MVVAIQARCAGEARKDTMSNPYKRDEQATKTCWIVDVTEHGRRLIFNRVDLPADPSKLLRHINENLVGYCVRRSIET